MIGRLLCHMRSSSEEIPFTVFPVRQILGHIAEQPGAFFVRLRRHTIAKVIERNSEDVLQVEQGSLYPALHRLENRKWVISYWGTSENNRKAKFYRLTAKGRKRLVVERPADGGRWLGRLAW